MKKAIFAAIGPWLALSGCGLHTAVGPTWVGHRSAELQASASIATHAQRKSNAVVGFRVNAYPNDGLELRSAALHTGYDIILKQGWVSLEPGVDFGAGQPAADVFDGTGAYAGGTLATRVRLTGGDREPGFNIAYPIIELVASGHVGVWMPPEGGQTTARPSADRGVELGIRFALGSDLVSPNQGAIWRGGAEPDDRNRGPGGSP